MDYTLLTFEKIRENDRKENIAASVDGPSTFRQVGLSERIATQRAILNSEFYFGIGAGALSPDSPRMEP